MKPHPILERHPDLYPSRLIQALKRARLLVQRGYSDYICVALDYLNWELQNEAWALKELIAVRMGHSLEDLYARRVLPLEHWLVANKHALVGEVEDHLAMRRYRLAWIDHLIEELQAHCTRPERTT